MENNEVKKVYLASSIDLVDPSFLEIIKIGRNLGEVTVGLLTDKAIAFYKNLPLLTYEQRKEMIENIKGIKYVIPQETLDYEQNLRKIKPDYVVHLAEWKTSLQREARKKVIKILEEWEGKLVEPAYNPLISSVDLKKNLEVITPYNRLSRLRRLINSKPLIRILEVHNGLTSLIVENTKLTEEESGITKEFDGMWISSLTDSTAKGKPDIGIVDLTSRLNTIHQVLEGTTKPIIIDGDNGGETEHFVFTIKTLERLGISAIIIEDKKGLKKNSLFGTDVQQTQENIAQFSHKISEGKKAQASHFFMIVARIESLILKKGIMDALERAKAYIAAGADAIMIHSKEKDGQEIVEFCKEYSNFDNKVPLVAVPSTYSHFTEKELSQYGVNVVIYANHLLRSAYPAMKRTAETILRNERAHEVEKLCMPIKEVLTLIPGGK
jgi:phosphoenolpyruvate phosphomutase / 2-hydroxyethylphosphonate cytidylyltransferase